VLCRIRQLPREHPFLSGELADIINDLQFERREMHLDPNQSRYDRIRALLRECLSPGIRWRISVGIVTQFIAQLSGINAINYFSPRIFRSLGVVGTHTGLFATGIYGVVKTTTAIVAYFFLVDRFRAANIAFGRVCCHDNRTVLRWRIHGSCKTSRHKCHHETAEVLPLALLCTSMSLGLSCHLLESHGSVKRVCPLERAIDQCHPWSCDAMAFQSGDLESDAIHDGFDRGWYILLLGSFVVAGAIYVGFLFQRRGEFQWNIWQRYSPGRILPAPGQAQPSEQYRRRAIERETPDRHPRGGIGGPVDLFLVDDNLWPLRTPA